MMKIIYQMPVYILMLIFLLGQLPAPASGQPNMKGNLIPANFCIGSKEMKLCQMINEYRSIFELPAIPLSKSLCYTASLHAKDLFLHHPDQGACNFHSWSDKGFWKPFCYPGDEDKKNSVWDKPKEVTRYPAKGYEIVYWENEVPDIDSILSVWKTESYFNDFLMNTGKWEGKKWNAIGLAIYENFACAWFGEATDPEGPPWVCGNPPVIRGADAAQTSPRPVSKVSKVKTKNDSVVELPQAPGITGKGDSTKVFRPDSTFTYYIIVRTNVSKKLAEQIFNDYKSKGHNNARVIEKNGKIRISVYETKDRLEALTKLKEVRKTLVKDAWLLKE